MKNAFQDVADFHIACDQPVRTVPALCDPAEAALRISLINEEVNRELFPAIEAGDLVEIADALGDIIYVVIGTAHHYGIPLEAVWNEIQRSNMTKPDPETGKVKKREDGKILKGPSFSPADVRKILLDHGWNPDHGINFTPGTLPEELRKTMENNSKALDNPQSLT